MVPHAYMEYIERLEDKSGKMFIALGLVVDAIERGDLTKAHALAVEGKAAFFTKRIVSTNPSTLLSTGQIS